MLPFNQLSFWEKDTYFDAINYLILGSGIVGLSTAIALRKKHPKAKIVILERGYLPTGASTKNAGFACFGGAAEVLSDIQNTNEEAVRKTIQMRWSGLKKLRQRLGDKNILFDACGSFDLYRNHEQEKYNCVLENIDYLNAFVGDVIQTKERIFSVESNLFGFVNTPYLIKNQFDGKINTGKMMKKLVEYAIKKEIIILNGVEISAVDFSSKNKSLISNYGKIEAENVVFCTNGLSKRFFPELDLQPARAQVIISEPIKNLPWNGTFHLEDGYYYFRNIGNRILLGGARNKDFDGEQTEDIANTDFILNNLKELLYTSILPTKKPKIEHHWAGIMGVGKEKLPLIKQVQNNVFCGVRLGGMGVAMGTEVGEKLAKLIVK